MYLPKHRYWTIAALAVAFLYLVLIGVHLQAYEKYLFAVVHREPLRIVVDRNDLLFIGCTMLFGFYMLRRSTRSKVSAMELMLVRQRSFVDTEDFDYVAQRLHDRCTQELDAWLEAEDTATDMKCLQQKVVNKWRNNIGKLL